MKKKLKDSSGLTLIEMLCAIPILILLCILANTGLNMAMTNLRERTAHSETQILFSSLTNALADKLRYCVVTEKASGDPKYVLSIGKVTVDDGKLVVEADGTKKKLLYDGAYGSDGTDEAATRYEVKEVTLTPTVTGDTATFTVTLEVQGASAATAHITAEREFTVRCLNPVKKEGTP